MRTLATHLLGAAIAVAAVTLALPSSAQALPEQTWLVVIGNNEGDATEVGLLYAERDARELAEVLRTEGGVPTHRTVMLLGEDAATVRRELLEVNRTIRSLSRTAESPTALVVFYSGHADADALHLGGTTLPFSELRALVESSPASLRLLVVDACRSGAVTRVKGVRPAEAFEIEFEDEVATEGVAIITSSAAGESSQESDRLRASFFSHHLVNGLRGAADRDGNGDISIAEAYAYTYDQTLRSSGRTLDLQHPTYEYDVKGRGELVLTRPGAADRRTGSLRLGDAGTYLVSEQRGAGSVVAEVAPPRDRATLALPAGRYFVQERRQREYREYEVSLSPGREVDLARVSYDTVAYDRLVRRRGGGTSVAHGFTLIAGARGETLDGEGVAPQVVLGYGVDLPWLSVGVRFRGATVRVEGEGEAPARRHSEFGGGIVIQRYFDLDWVSLSFGLIAEAVYHRQDFDTDRVAPSREGFGGAFSGLFSVERRLFDGLSVRLEGGPMTTLFERDLDPHIERAARTEVHTAFTWWAAGGLVWRL